MEINQNRKKLERAVNWNIFEIQAALVIATDAKLEEEEKLDEDGNPIEKSIGERIEENPYEMEFMKPYLD